MVGVWEGLNLGSIPNHHMPSQKDPKISIERRCSTILPIRLPTSAFSAFRKSFMRQTELRFVATVTTDRCIKLVRAVSFLVK